MTFGFQLAWTQAAPSDGYGRLIATASDVRGSMKAPANIDSRRPQKSLRFGSATGAGGSREQGESSHSLQLHS